MLKNKKNSKEHSPYSKSEDADKKQTVEDTKESIVQDESTITTKETMGSEPEIKTQLKSEPTDWNDKYVRLYAEFDNFKRRTLKERIELIQTANKEVILSLLPILDDFDRANKSLETATEVNSIKEGVALIHHKLKNILSQKGLKEMECKGQTFNADLHEGITNIPAQEETLKGKIVDELEKGYLLNDKVIRFAKVVIGS